MRRFERQQGTPSRRSGRQRGRRRRVLGIVGLSFSVGALTSMVLTSRLADVPDAAAAPPALVAGGTPRAPVPSHDPAGPTPIGPTIEAPDAPKPRATTGTSPGYDAAVDELRDRDLTMPVQGIDEDDLRDTYFDSRDGRAHEALDIMAPRHTQVRAVEDGKIVKLFDSKPGGLTIYMFDPSERYCYYFAHLDRYARGLREGQTVRRGDVIGFVGSTGNAAEDAPHLHFAIFRLTPEKQWWKGEPLNPYLVLKSLGG